jgi:glucokinase
MRDAAGIGSRLVLGVDLGGTKVRAALADADGAVRAELVEPADAAVPGALAVQVRRILGALRSQAGVTDPRDVRAAGFALPVTIHPVTGAIGSFHNVPGLGGSDPRGELAAALGIPVAVGNDADLAALAEGRHGAAIGERDYVVVAIGTGIGMGIVSGGLLVRGSRGRAGEIGYLPFGADPAERESLRTGAFERAVAGPALRRRIDAAVAADRTTALRPGASLDLVASAADAGDESARRILAEESRLIAAGIAAVAAVLDPAVVVLSGGVGAVPALLEPVRAALARLEADPPEIRTGRLGDRGPLVGAIDLTLELRDLARAASDPG